VIDFSEQRSYAEVPVILIKVALVPTAASSLEAAVLRIIVFTPVLYSVAGLLWMKAAVGTGGAPHGNGADAFAGAVAGYAVDFAVAKPTRKTAPGASRVGLNPWFLVNLVPPAIGATLAYDLSHR
jgi:hypothetical protein